MTFSVKKRLEELDLQPFEFEDKHGVTHAIQHLYLLDAEQADEINALLETDVREALKRIAGDEAASKAIATTPLAVLTELQEAWLAHCELPLGESEASSSSSARTARPSKPTSTASSRKRAPRKR